MKMNQIRTAMGIAQNVKSSVIPCTLQALYEAMGAPQTAQICAEIEDALEQVRRGEMSREDFETLKRDKKKQLPVLTPHATFTDGVRQNKTAVPSGLSMYDIDHIPDPVGYFNTMVKDRLAGRCNGPCNALWGRPASLLRDATGKDPCRGSEVDVGAIGRCRLRRLCEGLCTLLVPRSSRVPSLY